MSVCRSCLSSEAEFSLEAMALRTILSLCIDLSSPDLPQSICRSCRNVLIEFNKFRKRAQRADRTLKNEIGKTQIEDQNKSTFKIVDVAKEMKRKMGKANSNMKTEIKMVKLNEFDDSHNEVNESVSVDNLRQNGDLDVKNEFTQNLENYEDFCADISTSESNQNLTVRRRRQRDAAHVCELCGYRAPDRCCLRVHARFHSGEKPYTCNQCRKTFATRGNLKAHLRTHTGERPFVCELCGRAFAAAASLRGHARTHTGEKPYGCEQCGRRFTLRSNLRQHVRTHSGEKPYSCDMCDRAFTSSSYVRSHRRTHTGERPHACTLCPRRFAAVGNLRAHARTHVARARRNANADLQCPVCGEQFDTKIKLKGHTRTHKNQNIPNVSKAETQHVCQVCSKSFARKCNYVAHKKRDKCKKEKEISTNQSAQLTNETEPSTNRSEVIIQHLNPNVIVHSQQIIRERKSIDKEHPTPLQPMAVMQIPSVNLPAHTNTLTAFTTVIPVTLVPISILR